MTAPPFVASLVNREYAWTSRGFFNIGPWVRDRAGVRRTLEIDLPIVHTFAGDDLPPVGEPVLER